MGRTKKNYIVPGYNMTQDDVDSLLYYVASLEGFSESDYIHVYPVMRKKDGTRVNIND